jgi:hypothetical protein
MMLGVNYGITSRKHEHVSREDRLVFVVYIIGREVAMGLLVFTDSTRV